MEGFENYKGWAHEGNSELAPRVGLGARQEVETKKVAVLLSPADFLACILFI